MNEMDKYADDTRYPSLFREALSQNGKALEFFCARSEEERLRLAEGSRRCRSHEEMREYVNTMVGRERGHPPFQL